MRPVDDLGLGSQLFLDSRLDSGEMRARKTDGVALLHAGREDDFLRAPVDKHLSPGYGPLTGATPAGDEADNLGGSCFLEGTRARSGNLEVRGARTHILSLTTSDDSNFHLSVPLLYV